MRPPHIHITGASGSGVSTLGRALARATGAMQYDTDDFYWLPVKPDYSAKRPAEERLRLLHDAFETAGARGWILSGSISDWGAPLVPLFAHVIFLRTPTAIRMERLKAREVARYGEAAVAPGGERREDYLEFLEWAADYDAGTVSGRNLARHEAFLAGMTCPVLRLDGSQPTEEMVAQVLDAIKPPA
jgi:adenylate kinase family enzyme